MLLSAVLKLDKIDELKAKKLGIIDELEAKSLALALKSIVCGRLDLRKLIQS